MTKYKEYFDKMVPNFDTWEEFAEFYGDNRFCVEKGTYLILQKMGLDNVEFLDIPITNRFDQVDRGVWADDVFGCNFIEGPYLNITGNSGREYDVVYGNPIDGTEDSRLKQKTGMWSRPNKKYYRDWTITAYLDNEVNEWIKENKITDVKEIRESFGQAPTGMSGANENVLFISVWYQAPD